MSSRSDSSVVKSYSLAPTSMPISSTTPLRGDQHPSKAQFGDVLDDADADDDVSYYIDNGGGNGPYFYPLGGYDDADDNLPSPSYQTGYRGLKIPPKLKLPLLWFYLFHPYILYTPQARLFSSFNGIFNKTIPVLLPGV